MLRRPAALLAFALAGLVGIPLVAVFWPAWRRFWYWPVGDAGAVRLVALTAAGYVVAAVMWAWAWRRMRPHAAPPSPPPSGRRPRGV